MGDGDAVAELYADGAMFYSHPFRDPLAPRAYVEWVFGEQANAQCRFGEPIVEGSRAAIDWWAAITAIDGSVESIAGTSLLRFDEEGRVVEQREAWAAVPERRDLPDWAC